MFDMNKNELTFKCLVVPARCNINEKIKNCRFI